jgi:prephenate dehydrogenase
VPLYVVALVVRRTVNDIITIMQIAIIGLGLIGGSLGLALKKRNWHDTQIVGYVRSQTTGQIACGIGAIDRFELSLDKTVRDADIAIIATPVRSIRNIFTQIAPYLRPDCIVTDTASTKTQVMKWAQELLPPRINFIGGHPMAGKETFGIKAAAADLFKNAVYCLVQYSQTKPATMQIITDMVENIGAIPLFINDQEHDKMVAGVSHLPLLLSVALTLATTRNSDWSQMSRLAATGYRDLTRLASGNPEVNSDICISNKSAIVYWIDEFSKELQKLRNLVNKGDEEIQRALTMASEARQEWLEKRQLK